MPLLDVVRLDTMVTVVDSSVFLDAYTSRDTLLKRPELGLNELMEAEGRGEEGVYSLDIETRATAQREVAELLVEQVEYADVVILNKDGLLPFPQSLPPPRGRADAQPVGRGGTRQLQPGSSRGKGEERGGGIALPVG